MSTPITAVTMWAAISPPRRGHRWINQSSLSRTRREAKEKLLVFWERGERTEWQFWKAEGWTIERVFVSAVQMAPSE